MSSKSLTRLPIGRTVMQMACGGETRFTQQRIQRDADATRRIRPAAGPGGALLDSKGGFRAFVPSCDQHTHAREDEDASYCGNNGEQSCLREC
jgi:hypothetical protein